MYQHNSTGVNSHAAFHRHGSDHQGTKGSASPKHFTAGSLKDVLGEVYFLGGAGKRWIISYYFTEIRVVQHQPFWGTIQGWWNTIIQRNHFQGEDDMIWYGLIWDDYSKNIWCDKTMTCNDMLGFNRVQRNVFLRGPKIWLLSGNVSSGDLACRQVTPVIRGSCPR